MKVRLLGVLITAGILAGGFVFWRSTATPGDGAPAITVSDVPSRGGQIVTSGRAGPRTFNRLIGQEQFSQVLSMLTQGRLVRVNYQTFEVEPWLAEKWDVSGDGLTYTFHLRPGVTWSDGVPFTSDDVLFSVQAIFDPTSESFIADTLKVEGKPIAASARDAATVVITFPAPSGPGLRLLDSLWIVPKHKLEGALKAGTFAKAWGTDTPPSEIVGMGPFVLREYVPNQRLIFDRNPRYWRKAADGTPLPYLDRIVYEIIPDQDAELLRLQSGDLDLTQSELRPGDYVPAKRAEDKGTLKVTEIGLSPQADAFWFNLKPEAWKDDPRFAFVRRPEFRQAISYAVDREKFAENVFLGAAVPIWGPVTPGNTVWFWPDVPRYFHDVNKAKEVLKGLGLEDRNGNGVVEDAQGHEARFTVITQRGIGGYERGLAELRTQLAQVGIAIEPAPLENATTIQRMVTSDYEAMYSYFGSTDVDPASQLDMWLSSGDAHFWHFGDSNPEPWEARIDALMKEQMATLDQARRKEIFNDVQRIFAENLPVIYFATPRMYYAYNARLQGVKPSVLRPVALWNADMLSVRPSGTR
ncbi:MAG TPA: ABC transporter substrate-binding protein [Vicinamibacterales bacterium]|nr:ABC transporter substrate-binding protein [Vicinamibacterales bacterium]